MAALEGSAVFLEDGCEHEEQTQSARVIATDGGGLVIHVGGAAVALADKAALGDAIAAL